MISRFCRRNHRPRHPRRRDALRPDGRSAVRGSTIRRTGAHAVLRDLRALLLEHKPAILAGLSAGRTSRAPPGVATRSRSTASPSSSVKPYDEAEALIAEMLADAAGKPVALDHRDDARSRPSWTAWRRLSRAGGRQRRGDRFSEGGEKSGDAPSRGRRHTETADAKLKVSDRQIDYAECAGLDPHRAEIRLVQVYGGGPALRSSTSPRRAQRP